MTQNNMGKEISIGGGMRQEDACLYPGPRLALVYAVIAW